MGEIIDKYHLNLYCICIGCKNREINNKAYSCPAYPEEKGIPSEVWNGKNVECPYFESKQQETGENPEAVSEEYLLLENACKKNYRMKKFSDIITKEK